DLLVDGGVMNGLPADVMRRRPDIGTVIAVNVTPPRPMGRDYAYGPSVSGWRIALDRLRGKPPHLRPPSILETLVRTTEVNAASGRSAQYYQEQSDLLISPSVGGIGTTDFTKCGFLVQAGYEAARAPLGEWLSTNAPSWLRQRCEALEGDRAPGEAAALGLGRQE